MFRLDTLGIVHFPIFCLAVLLLNLTPGPDTAFIVGQSITHGRRAGLLSVLGISAGCLVHTAALAIGLTAVLAASAGAFTIVKIAGAAYLVFLGLRMIVTRAPSIAATSSNEAPGRHRTPLRRAFVQGFLTNVLNPKVALFFLSFMPQFVASTSPSKSAAFVVLGLVIFAMSTVYNGLVASIAGSVTRRVRAVPRVKAWLDRSIGVAFVALGARLAFTER